VIGHRQCCDAADHAENRREHRPLILEQQSYAHHEGGDPAEGCDGEPIPAHARHNRQRLLKIDYDCPHQLLGVSLVVLGPRSTERAVIATAGNVLNGAETISK